MTRLRSNARINESSGFNSKRSLHCCANEPHGGKYDYLQTIDLLIERKWRLILTNMQSVRSVYRDIDMLELTEIRSLSYSIYPISYWYIDLSSGMRKNCLGLEWL